MGEFKYLKSIKPKVFKFDKSWSDSYQDASPRKSLHNSVACKLYKGPSINDVSSEGREEGGSPKADSKGYENLIGTLFWAKPT